MEQVGGWAEWCITEDTELGVRLFERGARSTRLTEEGALLLERASGPLGSSVWVSAATPALYDRPEVGVAPAMPPEAGGTGLVPAAST